MHFYIPARENANFTKIPFKVYVATRTMKVHRNKLNKILCILYVDIYKTILKTIKDKSIKINDVFMNRKSK